MTFICYFYLSLNPQEAEKRTQREMEEVEEWKEQNKGKHFVVHGKLSFKAFFIFIRSEGKTFRSQDNHLENVQRSRFFLPSHACRVLMLGSK